MEPRTVVKKVQTATLAVIILVTVLKTAECEECYQLIRTNDISSVYSVKSPNYSNSYPDNYYCMWEFQSPPNCTLRLKFTFFELQSSRNCSDDYVALYDGNNTADPLLGKFCGSQAPPDIKSTADRMLMVFRSDGSVSKRGFEILPFTECYQLIRTNDILNAYYINSAIYSKPYPVNYYWMWEFQSPPNCTVRVKFTFFELQSSRNCSDDYIALYDGNTTVDTLLGKFCGSGPPPQSKSTTDRMLMVFRSDGSVSKRGFEAYPSTVCLYSIKTSDFINTAEVTSPNYPSSYPTRYYSKWSFETTPNCIIRIKFDTFHLETAMYDHVVLYDGNTMADRQLGKFCGNETPPAITSTANRMLMIFESDGSKTFAGFGAAYSTECFHFVSSTNDIVTSPNYPDRYPHHYEGIWKFETNPGYSINVTFDSFKVEHGDTASVCSKDYVEFFDGDSAILDNRIGIFCGSEIPHAILSKAHKMFMVFRSDNSVALEGFRATISKVLNFKTTTTDEIERNLTQYLLNTRQRTLGINKWGTDITRTAVALFMSDHRFFAPGNETGEEIAYELSLQMMSKLVLKKRIYMKDLALFVNAMTVACINPKNFFGVNIVAQLRKRIDAINYTNPFFVLALCNSGEYMKMEDVDKLRQLFSTHLSYSETEIQAMVVMALKCISKQSDRNLSTTLNEMAFELKKKQQINGAVDNLKNTALVVQALIATENYETDFNMSLEIQSILKELNHTHVGVQELFYVLPIFKWNTLLDINSNHCTNTVKTDLEQIIKLREDPDKLIQVQLSVVIGDDMDFSRTWRIKVDSNFSFYQVLENISSTEPNYKFRYIISGGKPYVADLASFQGSTTDDSFWFIYKKALSSADDPILLEQSPVDIQVNETHELILWYRSGPLPSTQKISSDDSS